MKKIKPDRITGIDILIVLLMINYMVVTIIMKDSVVFKYLRDFLLLLLLLSTICVQRFRRIRNLWLLMIFAVFVLISIPKASTLNTGIVAARRYLFPVLVYVVAYSVASKNAIQRLMSFILPFFAILALWGVFQALVLKDVFLKNLGYPQAYLPAYGRIMLPQAYYFGNFGVQRVTSTMSSPNVLALIWGVTGVFLLINRSVLKSIKHWKICLGVLLLGYLLTISRSNFVALAIVGLLLLLPHVPHKQYWLLGLAILAFGFLLIGICQGQQGMVYKLWKWVGRSLTFKESSAAGRLERWLAAMEYVKRNPMGMGPGYVGSVATNAGKQTLYFDAENSYLCLALDAGWGAVLAYYSFYLVSIIQARRNEKQFKKTDKELALLNKTSYTLILYIMIVMFFSNHVQDMEATSFLFLYLGLINGYTARRKANDNYWLGRRTWQSDVPICILPCDEKNVSAE